jgi:asparagine synthase (glutamine-hydrolysing)
MSTLFGRWNFDGKAVDPEYIGKVRAMLDAHSPDGVTICVKSTFVILYGALHVTDESRREQQPAISPAGTFLTWDGRLDNRAELLPRLACRSSNPSDLEIVAESWEKEGTLCLGSLVGDWSLSVLNHYERTLILARDFLGSRPLYYLRNNRYIAWSTVLEPLLLCPEERFTLCEEYIAGWLAGYPEAHLTPYEEIRAVPPASLVRITSRTATVEKYWDFHPLEESPCKSDAEYEERFRVLFFDAVHRRLRSRSPVLAQLSGGMDSSAIVCAADHVAANRGVRPVETVSYFDDSEPNWNERPFFTAVEVYRGRTGFHLDVASDGLLLPQRGGSFPVTPAHGGRPTDSQVRLARHITEGNFQVLLSGSGGDEFTGGAPTGIPELADLLSRAEFRQFLRRAFLWAMASRKPLLHVAGKSIRTFLPTMRATNTSRQWPMPWLTPSFARRNQKTLSIAVTRFRWRGPLPTFQENLRALDGLRRQIACAELPPAPCCEKRYPFLDRDLLEFLFNIPREQLVRPNQRRSLFRRALRGIVPDVVLDRPRKAFVATSHLKAVAADWRRIMNLTETMMLESSHTLDSNIFRETLEQARHGGDVPLLPAMRALRLEWWMQDMAVQGLFKSSSPMRTNPLLLDHRAAGSA